MFYKFLSGLSAMLLAALTAAQAADAPGEIKLGTLYASSGRYASISMPVHYGLKLWIEQKNAEGGVFVKAFDKKIPLKLVAYDDQSNTATAATLYNQLITQDKVDILIADSGSVLTSVAVPIARDHKMLLIDQTGTGAAFYAPDDIAFLRNLQDSGQKFKFLFCIYPGLETELLVKNVGAKGLHHVFTYVPSSEIDYQTNFGMPLKEYREAWHKKYGDTHVEF